MKNFENLLLLNHVNAQFAALIHVNAQFAALNHVNAPFEAPSHVNGPLEAPGRVHAPFEVLNRENLQFACVNARYWLDACPSLTPHLENERLSCAAISRRAMALVAAGSGPGSFRASHTSWRRRRTCTAACRR